jgi:flagellar assembly protein FliH
MSSMFDFEPLQPRAAAAEFLDGDSFAGEGAGATMDAHAAGYAAGLEESRGACVSAIMALEAAVEDIQALRAEIAAQVERQAVELALKIAEQALGAAVAADPELVLGAVRGALRRLVERERVIVLVNPDDLDLVRESCGTLLAELGGIEHLEVQADRRVPQGGAIVRTAEGEVDATLETKLQRAREVLERELTNA